MKKYVKKNKSGIYKIHCIGNGRNYIGSSIKHLQRWSAHRSMLRKGTHNNRHLQNAYNKYGKRSFIYILIEECLEIDLIKREQFWIDAYDFDRLMNSSPTATTSLGFKHSTETIKILSEKAKKRNNSHLKKYHFKKGEKNAFAGKQHTKETIEKFKKIASTRTYKTGGHNKGIPMAEEVKIKVSKSVSQNCRVYGDEIETKAKELREKGMTFKMIGEELNLSLAHAHRMCNGHRGTHTFKWQSTC
jgi:group I intron endonuclease